MKAFVDMSTSYIWSNYSDRKHDQNPPFQVAGEREMEIP